MVEKQINSLEMRKINRNRVFMLLYRNGSMSKQQITQTLNLSYPTVLQNLKELHGRGLVCESGSIASSGGRKARSISFNPTSRLSLGIDITRNHLSMVIVDLGANILAKSRERLVFQNNREYFSAIGQQINRMLSEHHILPDTVMGAGISVPGLLSQDSMQIEYAPVLNFTNGRIDAFAEFIPFPCRLINDATSAAIAECWNKNNISTMVYLSLSNSVGGAIYLNESFYVGLNLRSAEFGHMTIVPNGRPCYCGQRGCVDPYCNANMLSDNYDGNLRHFFELIDQGDSVACAMWNEYLHYLSLTINNLRMAFDCPVVLGGYIGSYMEPYIGRLREMVSARNSFEPNGSYLEVCQYKTEASAVGAALMYVKTFIDDI